MDKFVHKLDNLVCSFYIITGAYRYYLVPQYVDLTVLKSMIPYENSTVDENYYACNRSDDDEDEEEVEETSFGKLP